MSGLINERCSACRRDSPRVTETDIRELKPQIPEWTLIERDGIQRLERVFRFTNFTDALNFTNRVGALAEEEEHHTAILTEWGRVTVTLWTHKIRGLHRNDFIMAAILDSMFRGEHQGSELPGNCTKDVDLIREQRDQLVCVAASLKNRVCPAHVVI
jgi:4a-hydroxytetrahydrobiopterin dehydratase